jgi:hypothetical protein
MCPFPWLSICRGRTSRSSKVSRSARRRQDFRKRPLRLSSSGTLAGDGTVDSTRRPHSWGDFKLPGEHHTLMLTALIVGKHPIPLLLGRGPAAEGSASPDPGRPAGVSTDNRYGGNGLEKD